MHHGMKTYGMEADIHAVSISTVQYEWSASKYRSLQSYGKSRVYKMNRGPARFHRLSGCVEEITEIYHRLCCRPFRSLQSLHWATPAPYVRTAIQIWTVPKIAVYRAAWSSCFETSPPPHHKLCKCFYYPNSAQKLTQHIWMNRTMRDSLQTTGHCQTSRTIYVTNCDKHKVRGTAFRPPEKEGKRHKRVFQLCGSLRDESECKRNTSPATARRLTGTYIPDILKSNPH